MKEETHGCMKYFVKIFGKVVQTDKETFEMIMNNPTCQSILWNINSLYEEYKTEIDEKIQNKS